MRAACVVALVSVWCAIVTTTAPSASSPILLVAAAAAGLMLLIVRSAAKQQRQLRRDDYAATMTADSTGLTIARPHSFTRIEWAGLEGLDVTPVRILLRTLSTTGYVIPSTCFRSAEDLRLFVTLAGGIDADNAGRA
ncbi:MAG: hypothetical protein JWM34_4604 [Ilumatobacteraceae bacterium]|nr:hypothetical protein [Ilumatobacteraceae bacterium]